MTKAELSDAWRFGASILWGLEFGSLAGVSFFEKNEASDGFIEVFLVFANGCELSWRSEGTIEDHGVLC